MSKLDDIRAVAYAVDAYANAADDVRYLLTIYDALASQNARLYAHLHEVHYCNCDLTPSQTEVAP